MHLQSKNEEILKLLMEFSNPGFITTVRWLVEQLKEFQESEMRQEDILK
jgi:superfamily I DNA and RNA helicase